MVFQIQKEGYMRLIIVGVLSIILTIAVALPLQDSWVKNKCLHPVKDFESQKEIVLACLKTSWMAVLVETFSSESVEKKKTEPSAPTVSASQASPH